MISNKRVPTSASNCFLRCQRECKSKKENYLFVWECVKNNMRGWAVDRRIYPISNYLDFFSHWNIEYIAMLSHINIY